MTVVETDLGEWILQLAHERPSHLIAPAVHKTREEIAALFSKVLGHPVGSDPAELVAVARDKLRDSFIRPTSASPAGTPFIAETGTLVLVTNEGNADLATDAAGGAHRRRRHREDRAEPRRCRRGPEAARPQRDRAEAQHLHAVHHRTVALGRHRAEDRDRRARTKELHFVLIDNGRTAMREDGAFREALRCIRCGACSNVCPSYQVVGGHIFGHIYTGPIGLVVSPFHHGIDSVAYEQQMCLGCNACDTVCPVGIPLAAADPGCALPRGGGIRPPLV